LSWFESMRGSQFIQRPNILDFFHSDDRNVRVIHCTTTSFDEHPTRVTSMCVRFGETGEKHAFAREHPPLSNNELDALGPLSTAAIEYHRVDTGRRGDEHPMFSASTKAQVRYSLRHKNLAHQVPVRSNAVHTVGR
jgi:hypothetical protein